MFRRAIEALRRAVSPEGPIGEFLSPSDVFKTRAGLPVSSPRAYAQLAVAAPVDFAEIEKACAPQRFVVVNEGEAPKSRERVVSLYIVETWRPVYELPKGDSIMEIAMAAQSPRLLGWTVVQTPRAPFCDCTVASFTKRDGAFIHRECGRSRAALTSAEIVARAKTAQMQPSDAFYEGYYETIPGKDRGIVEGVEVVGGTQIRSRRDYQQKTKGWVHWDRGTPAAVEKAKAEANAKRAAHLNRVIEERAHRMVSDRPGDL
jgi:hypothetical protein